MSKIFAQFIKLCMIVSTKMTVKPHIKELISHQKYQKVYFVDTNNLWGLHVGYHACTMTV